MKKIFRLTSLLSVFLNEVSFCCILYTLFRSGTQLDGWQLVVTVATIILWAITFFLLVYYSWIAPWTIQRARTEKELLRYTCIDNAILLTNKTIEAKGFHEVWRQRDRTTGATQILCYNPELHTFQAYDRFLWAEELYPYTEGLTQPKPNCMIDGGAKRHEELWTPIQLHFTLEWLRAHSQLLPKWD